MGNVIDHDRRQQRALTAWVIEDFSALFRGRENAVFKQFGGLCMDYAAQFGGWILWVAETDFLCLFKHQRDELVSYALLHEDAFDCGTTLAGITRRARNRDGGGLVQIGLVQIVQHDQRVVAAQFQRLTLIHALGGDHLAHRHAAGKGDDVDVFVGDHLVADITRPAGHHLEHLGRQPGLIENVRQCQAGQRRQFGRFAHHAVIGGNGRRDLVADHVERVVEGRDRRNRLHRLAQGENLAVLAVMRQVTAENLAIVLQRLGGGELIHILRAFGFVDGVLVADPQLQRQPFRQIIAAFADQVACFLKDLAALIAGQRGGVIRRDVKGARRVFRRARGDVSHDLVGIGVMHRHGGVGKDHLAADAHSFVADVGFIHLVHAVTSSRAAAVVA